MKEESTGEERRNKKRAKGRRGEERKERRGDEPREERSQDEREKERRDKQDEMGPAKKGIMKREQTEGTVR